MSTQRLVLAAYKLFPLADPAEEVRKAKAFFAKRDVKGRIYICDEGLNIQLSGAPVDVQDYMQWLGRLGDWDFKLQSHPDHVFPRLSIKERPLVALGFHVDLRRRAEAVSTRAWRTLLEEGSAHLVDVRNTYEWDIGRFRGSECPPCKSFRDFPIFAKKLKSQVGLQAPIMMCCTGGIRCEYYGAHLKNLGFERVYQLDGGILKYSEEQGGKYWDGKLFVFDDRLSVEVNPTEARIVGRCHRCKTPNEDYFNCANMDCNRLFLSCPVCLEELAGCCQAECQRAKRLRPLSHQSQKPFRKWYHYFQDGECSRH